MRWWLATALLITTKAVAQPVDTHRMDEIVRSFVDDGLFMGAVLVAHGDEVVFERAYGEADLEWHIPNSMDTRFRIASITKQFTAAAILLLEEQGRLRLSDTVIEFVPDLPEAWREVTIFQLLTHTSGVDLHPKVTH